MLHLNLRDTIHPVLKQLLTDFRRVQVSRFPIDVVQHGNDDTQAVKFVDSRFPSDAWRRDRILAYLAIDGYDAKNRPKLKLHSRLIENEKYSDRHDDYHQKVTADPKKMASWLREYVKPYSQEEVMGRSPSNIAYEYAEWIAKPRQEFREVVHQLSPEDVAEEIMYLQSVGVQFRSEKFRQIASQGVELYTEAKQRENNPKGNVHVFIQPDESILVTAPRQQGFATVELQFESLDRAPESIQQQVAMLRLCERGHYIPEVGRMNSDRDFWVHVNPSDLNSQNT